MTETQHDELTECLDEPAIDRFVHGAVGQPELDHISQHIIECETCYRRVADASRRRSDAATASVERPLFPAMLTALAIAMALTILLFLLLP